MIRRLKEFIDNAIRVLKLAKKPSPEEYRQMVKITGLGFLILGSIGYIFQLIVYLLRLG